MLTLVGECIGMWSCNILISLSSLMMYVSPCTCIKHSLSHVYGTVQLRMVVKFTSGKTVERGGGILNLWF